MTARRSSPGKRSAAGATAPKVASTPRRASGKRKPGIATIAELMTYAYAMETEAAERYAEFADAMEAHNNPEVAELFRKLARIEHQHGEQVLQAMGWATPPPHRGGFRWLGTEAPESGERAELHYLMHPYHALRIAHQNEQRAYDFFSRVARSTGNAAVRRAAAEIEEEEREHVHLIEEWLKRTPQPPSDWAFDPDPPTGVT
jgi:rubrerythrin